MNNNCVSSRVRGKMGVRVCAHACKITIWVCWWVGGGLENGSDKYKLKKYGGL